MNFDKLVNLYLEEFDATVFNRKGRAAYSTNGTTISGNTPDGFKGNSLSTPSQQLLSRELFPQRINKILKRNRKNG